MFFLASYIKLELYSSIGVFLVLYFSDLMEDLDCTCKAYKVDIFGILVRESCKWYCCQLQSQMTS